MKILSSAFISGYFGSDALRLSLRTPSWKKDWKKEKKKKKKKVKKKKKEKNTKKISTEQNENYWCLLVNSFLIKYWDEESKWEWNGWPNPNKIMKTSAYIRTNRIKSIRGSKNVVIFYPILSYLRLSFLFFSYLIFSYHILSNLLLYYLFFHIKSNHILSYWSYRLMLPFW